MTETPDEHPTEHLPPQPPEPPAPAAPAAPLPAQPDVFAPQQRAPRAPWVNPARRSKLTAVAVGAAVVLFGAGFGIGWAASDGGGGHGGHRDWMRHPGYMQPYQGGPRFVPPGHQRKPKQPRPAQSATVAPNPTKTG